MSFKIYNFPELIKMREKEKQVTYMEVSQTSCRPSSFYYIFYIRLFKTQTEHDHR